MPHPRPAAWNSDKPHRCPHCHTITATNPTSWRVYTCCQCGTRFTRWPRLAWLLPRGARCPEGLAGFQDRGDTPCRGAGIDGTAGEVLPAHLLARILMRPYLSTACDTAQTLAAAASDRADPEPDLSAAAEWLHTRCRRSHKFTGATCICGCHDDNP